jgi:hypothetical protein
MENINDQTKWGKFVAKLIDATKRDEIHWSAFDKKTSREDATSPIYVAKIVTDKFVGTYRYNYRYYEDADVYEMRQDIAVELVDSRGNRLWRIPNVSERYQLMDLIEFKDADALGTLEEFLGKEEA